MPPRIVALVAILAAGLIALPACEKKNKEVVPDTKQPDPPPPIKTPETPTGNGNNPIVQEPFVPGLPTAPSQRPLFNTAAAAPYRLSIQQNLKQIGLAMLSAHDQMNSFPAGIADSSGKPGLSWRVAILPFLEQDALYKQFKLDEPWDSEHNKQLISKMPKVFGSGNADTFGYTFFRSFSGPGAFISPIGNRKFTAGQLIPGPGISNFTDGTSNTLLVAEAYDPVIWTKPDDLPFTPGKPPKLGGGVFANGFNALFADGAVKFLPMNLTPQELSNLIQMNDGNVVILP